MATDEQPFVRIAIRSPVLDVFQIDESIDIRPLIVNKKDKFDVSSANPNQFPDLFNKFRHLCACRFYSSIVLGFAISFLIMFIVFASTFTHSYAMYLTQKGAIWTFLALAIFFSLLWPPLYFLPIIVGRSYNKKYLASLKSLFTTMQNQGYIEKDLTKYPDSLQMAFWQSSWFKWHQDLNHYLLHYRSWYGFLALKYFLWAYNNLKFPIDEISKWDCWFNKFVGLYGESNGAYLSRVFGDRYHP